MDRRMASYGNQVVSYHPTSSSYSPQKSKLNYSHLNDKISDLSTELQTRHRRHQESQIISSLSSLVSSINSPIKLPSVPPIQDFSSILSTFQRQQELMLNMMQSLSSRATPPRSRRNKNKYKKYSDSNSESAQQPVRRPEEIKQILAEFNFDDDGAEDYADKEQKLKFNSDLTDEEKYKIVMQMEKNKRQNVQIENTLKGIRRFRRAAIMVLFPIVLVSNMLEKRAKFYSESFRNMEEQVQVFADVAQSWIMKVMRVALISTVNDTEMDLVLGNKESEVKSQQGNIKIVKLQVRINGILEGLENFTNDKEMPGPFKSFINKLTTNRSYVPPKFLTKFEKTRLEYNEFGGLINMSEDKKKMIISFFFITKTLIKKICLRPSEAGIPVQKGSKTVDNLKMIASIFQVAVVFNFLKVGRRQGEVAAEELDYIKRKKGAKLTGLGENNEDGVSGQLFCISEFEASFNYISPFVEIVRKRLFVWAGKMLDLCENYRINPLKRK